MMFGFWNRKPQLKPQSRPIRPRSTARFGGMQVRELQTRLELLVDAVLTRNHSVIDPARALAEFSLVEQERFLASVDRISLINPEFALRFCYQGIPALSELDDTAWEPWVDSLLETFSDKGIEASTARIEAFRAYQEEQIPGSSSVAFSDIARMLEIFIQALNGRALKLATSAQNYTDTETLFLPTHINHYTTRDENFRLYKALLIHQWAQIWFGTWRTDFAESLKQYPDPDRALHLFHCLETRRLDACVERGLPGMARDMAMFRSDTGETHALWRVAQIDLQKPDADVQTSLNFLSQLYPLQLEPVDALYQGQLCTEKTAAVLTARGQREQSALQEALSVLHHKNIRLTPDSPGRTAADRSEFRIAQQSERETAEPPRTQLEYNGNAVETPPELQALLDSIAQDKGEIPEYFLKTVDTDDNNAESEQAKGLPDNDKSNTQDFLYDEWDHSRQRYRKNWCQLHEQCVNPVAGSFVTETLSKYQMLLKQLRRSFEALRQDQLQLKREPFGDNIDIDALVEAWADTCNGLEASDRLFIQTRRQDRNVAVMFMVDMSASTAGWINQVERESLVLLCEALELLGDRYAIYGFSGCGNRHCQTYHIKDFDEPYNDEVRGRIEAIQAQDYTRLGAAIRHLGAKLNRIEARTRILITLSDGRPDDVDGYRGPYGIEDTRKALIEMRYLGVHPYCITIDTGAREYLPHMFGKNGFIIINQVEKLPQRIADIYRSLTH